MPAVSPEFQGQPLFAAIIQGFGATRTLVSGQSQRKGHRLAVLRRRQYEPYQPRKVQCGPHEARLSLHFCNEANPVGRYAGVA